MQILRIAESRANSQNLARRIYLNFLLDSANI